uniref:Uncharacterized protein n=1 Tax=Rhizophora mucronata TaxID=61149 RepID=A0A2P2NR20_RHIMU
MVNAHFILNKHKGENGTYGSITNSSLNFFPIRVKICEIDTKAPQALRSSQ